MQVQDGGSAASNNNTWNNRREASRLIGRGNLIVAEQLDDDDADHPVVEHQHEGDYIKMMNDWNLSLRSTGMALLLALNWSFFLHLALSRQEPVTWTHNAIHKVLYFVAVSGSFKLEGVPPVGVYVVCSTIGPWNVGDYIQIHSALSLTAECWYLISFAFVCICLRLFAFVCICLHLFAFVFWFWFFFLNCFSYWTSLIFGMIGLI